MRIYSDNNSLIKKKIDMLLCELNNIKKSKRIDKISYNVGIIDSLQTAYEVLTDICYMDRKIKKELNNPVVVKYEDNIYEEQSRNFLKLRNFHNSLAASLLSPDFKDIEFLEPSVDIEDSFCFSEVEEYKIESDFLKSFNKDSLDIYNYLIKNKRIYYNGKEEFYSGFSLIDLLHKDGFIFVTKSEGSISSMITRQHELGHFVDEFYYPLRNKYSYLLKTSLMETIAYFHQKEFIDFLIKEGIKQDVSEMELTSFYHDMYDEIDDLCILYSLKDKYIYHDNYKNLSKYELITKVIESDDQYGFEVDMEDFDEPYNMDISCSFKYAYGPLVATYLSYLRKHDKDKFNDSFNRFLKIRSNYLEPDFLEKIGTNRDEFVNIIDEEIMTSPAKVKIIK